MRVTCSRAKEAVELVGGLMVSVYIKADSHKGRWMRWNQKLYIYVLMTPPSLIFKMVMYKNIYQKKYNPFSFQKQQKISSVFQQWILEEHWLSRFSSYLWYWGIEDVGEGRGNKDKWKEEEETFNLDKGWFVWGLSILYYLLSSILFYDYYNTLFYPPYLWYLYH